MTWLRRLLSRTRLERELDLEVAFHIDRLTDDLAARGLTREEARRQALVRFGGIEPIKEAARDARGTRWAEHVAQDVRQAFRSMGRAKAFTIAAVSSLALGVGANTGVFAVIEALLLRPLPVTRPAELFFLERTGYEDPNLRFSHPTLEALRRAVPDVPLAGMSSTARMQVLVGSSTEFAIGQLVTGNWFRTLGVPPQVGRMLTEGRDRGQELEAEAVLSDGYWRRRFGADRSVVGRALRLNGVVVTVVGVAPAGFNGTSVGEQVDCWLPIGLQHDLRYQGNASISNADLRKPWTAQDGVEWLTVIARVPGGPASAAARRLDDAYRIHRALTFGTVQDPERLRYFLREHARFVRGERGLSNLREEMSAPLFVLMAAVALLLLVACANLASLLLSRGAARAAELAVRSSLGATRGRLLAQLLTESSLLALLGGGLGVVVARWSSDALLRLASPTASPIPLDVEVDWRYLAFALGLSLATAVLVGLLPAIRLSRAALSTEMNGIRRVAGSDRLGRVPIGKALVVTQVALALTLLVGASLFGRTFANLVAADAGFERGRVLAARFDPRLAGYSDSQLPALYAGLLERARLVPGVRTASLAVEGVVSGSSRTSSITVEGRPTRPDDVSATREEFVGPDYFATLGIRLLSGRAFADGDDARGRKVAVVSEAFARRFLEARQAVGRRIGYGPADVEIVGVVQDVRVDGPREAAPEMVYYPLSQRTSEYARYLYIRVDGATGQARADLRRAVNAAAPGLAIREVMSLDEMTERMVSNERVVSSLTAVFGLLALAVACLGLYGTVSYSVARRSNEIGIRLALGAPVRAVRWMVLRETLGLALVGLALGFAIVMAGLGSIGSLLYGLTPRDPATLLGAAAVVTLVSAVAGAIPARRAARIDPICALRRD
jgi:predicted permease